jgi:hypothetical protein
MSTILLVISLLLHVVAFYFIVVLYMKYSNVKDLSYSQRKLLEETENSMTSFLIEMKDENERLLQSLTKSLAYNSSQVNESENKAKETVEFKANTSVRDQKDYMITKNQEDLPDYLSRVMEVEDILEINQPSHKKEIPFEIEAINLYKNGHTVEQIAKKLNKGKTEIDLLLKFRQK